MLENYAFVLDVSFSKYDLGLVLLNNARKKLEAKTETPEQVVQALSRSEVRPIKITTPPSMKKNAASLVHPGKIKKVVSKKEAVCLASHFAL